MSFVEQIQVSLSTDKTDRQKTQLLYPPPSEGSKPHLRMNVHDTHLAILDHVQDRVRLNTVEMLLVLSKFNELVFHDFSSHVVFTDKIETVGVLVGVGLPCCVYREGEGGEYMEVG